jgi:hypothetical protein
MINASHAYFNILDDGEEEDFLANKGNNDDIENVDEVEKRATPNTYTERPPPDSSNCFNVNSSDHSRIHEVRTFFWSRCCTKLNISRI